MYSVSPTSSTSVGSLTTARRNYLGVRFVPITSAGGNIASVRFGAVVAVSEVQDDFRFVPTTDPHCVKVSDDLRPINVFRCAVFDSYCRLSITRT